MTGAGHLGRLVARKIQQHPEYKDPGTFGEYRLTYRTGDVVSPRIDATEPLSFELRDFGDAVTSGVTPCSSAAIGREIVPYDRGSRPVA